MSQASPASTYCARCNARLEPGAKFCAECGARQVSGLESPAGERPITPPLWQRPAPPDKRGSQAGNSDAGDLRQGNPAPPAISKSSAPVPPPLPPPLEAPVLRGELVDSNRYPAPPVISPYAQGFAGGQPMAAMQNVQVHPGQPPPPQHQNINVYVTHGMPMQPVRYGPPPESATFALLTLMCYFLVWPVGALLNVVGLITGPKRGCFLAMFVFILMPTLGLIGLFFAMIASGNLK